MGSPVPLLKFQLAPRFKLLMSCGSKKKEPRYVCLSEAKSFTLTKNVGWGFILFHASYIMDCLLAPLSEEGYYVQSKKANKNPGLWPIKDQKAGLFSRTWVRVPQSLYDNLRRSACRSVFQFVVSSAPRVAVLYCRILCLYSPSASRRVASNTHGKWQSCQITKNAPLDVITIYSCRLKLYSTWRIFNEFKRKIFGILGCVGFCATDDDDDDHKNNL